jgi:hypothetical protein
MAIRRPIQGLRGNTRITDVTHNPVYSNFDDFRQVENERRSNARKNQIGQSEDSINDILGTQAAVVLYNYGNKDPLDRRKDLADKLTSQWSDQLRIRYSNYVRLSKRPEVRYVIETICNEAIVTNESSQIASLKINDNFPNIAIGNATKVQLQQDFNEMLQCVMDFDDNAWDWFKKFLIEGSIFYEVGYSDSMNKVTGVRLLPSYNMIVVVEDGVVVGYRQIIDKTAYDTNRQNMTYYTMGGDLTKDYIDYHPNQILWWDYKERGFGGINDRLSFLENARKVANQLKNIEDSIVRYRILRGHEKRAFYIPTGNMPPIKAEEHLRRQSENLNRRLYYNTEDGSIVGLEKITAMMEDYYFALPEGSQAAKIDTIPAGANLGEITDLNYFKQLLYQALLFPASRSVTLAGQQQGQATVGKPGEITRDEIVLTRFIERLQRSFSTQVVIPLFVMYLETMEKYEDDLKNEKFFTCLFTQSNLFKLYKEAEVTNTRFDILDKAAKYIDDGTEGPNAIFSKEFVLKKYFNLTDEEFAENMTLIQRERLQTARNITKKKKMDQENMELSNPADMTGAGGGGQFGGIETAANGMGGEPEVGAEESLPPETPEIPGEGEAPATAENIG